MAAVEMPEIVKRRRTELGMSQTDLAVRAKIDARQVRRYEAGEAQPSLAVARLIARALDMSVDELAGEPVRRLDLGGDWWACWQTWKDGTEYTAPQELVILQQGDLLHLTASTRGIPLGDGGYLWRGEMRLWDNEALLGWYVASEGAVRSKGTIYFTLHHHGIHMTGRWVGASYDGPLVTGWAALARSESEATELVDGMRGKPGQPT